MERLVELVELPNSSGVGSLFRTVLNCQIGVASAVSMAAAAAPLGKVVALRTEAGSTAPLKESAWISLTQHIRALQAEHKDFTITWGTSGLTGTLRGGTQDYQQIILNYGTTTTDVPASSCRSSTLPTYWWSAPTGSPTRMHFSPDA